MNLTQRIKEKALELGFDLIGIAPATHAPHAAAYSRWLDGKRYAVAIRPTAVGRLLKKK